MRLLTKIGIPWTATNKSGVRISVSVVGCVCCGGNLQREIRQRGLVNRRTEIIRSDITEGTELLVSWRMSTPSLIARHMCSGSGGKRSISERRGGNLCLFNHLRTPIGRVNRDRSPTLYNATLHLLCAARAAPLFVALTIPERLQREHNISVTKHPIIVRLPAPQTHQLAIRYVLRSTSPDIAARSTINVLHGAAISYC